MMERFAIIVNGEKPINIVVRLTTLEVCGFLAEPLDEIFTFTWYVEFHKTHLTSNTRYCKRKKKWSFPFDFLSKCVQFHSFLWICSHLLGNLLIRKRRLLYNEGRINHHAIVTIMITLKHDRYTCSSTLI